MDNETQIRANCLNNAIRVHGDSTASPEIIISAAEKFLAFIKGDIAKELFGATAQPNVPEKAA